MMRCLPRNMTLSKPGCARLWISANDGDRRPQPWEGRSACVVCPVGAASAGRTQSPVAGAVDAIRLTCPRCERPAQRLIHGRLCVSCYNREREVRIGKNRKGQPPRKLPGQLHGVGIVITDSTGATRIRQIVATCPVEVMIGAAQRARGWLAFSRPAVPFHV